MLLHILRRKFRAAKLEFQDSLFSNEAMARNMEGGRGGEGEFSWVYTQVKFTILLWTTCARSEDWFSNCQCFGSMHVCVWTFIAFFFFFLEFPATVFIFHSLELLRLIRLIATIELDLFAKFDLLAVSNSVWSFVILFQFAVVTFNLLGSRKFVLNNQIQLWRHWKLQKLVEQWGRLWCYAWVREKCFSHGWTTIIFNGCT